MADIPDVYTDSITVLLSEWGLTLECRATLPPIIPITGNGQAQIPSEPKVLIRMSHAHAKAFIIILKRQLKGYEGNFGVIRLPSQFNESQHLTPEDW